MIDKPLWDNPRRHPTQRAQDLENAIFEVSAQDMGKLEQSLDNPPAPNEALRGLMRGQAPPIVCCDANGCDWNGNPLNSEGGAQ